MRLMALGREMAASAWALGISEKATARQMAVPASRVKGGDADIADAAAMLVELESEVPGGIYTWRSGQGRTYS